MVTRAVLHALVPMSTRSAKAERMCTLWPDQPQRRWPADSGHARHPLDSLRTGPTGCSASISSVAALTVGFSGSSRLGRGRGRCSGARGRRRVVLCHVVHAELFQLAGLYRTTARLYLLSGYSAVGSKLSGQCSVLSTLRLNLACWGASRRLPRGQNAGYRQNRH